MVLENSLEIWARGALSMSITYRRPAWPSSGGDLSWREHVNVTYSYIDSTRFLSRLVAVVGWDMDLRRNYKIICWA
jgi:hypothetical protein